MKRLLSVSLTLIFSKNEKVEQHIKKKTINQLSHDVFGFKYRFKRVKSYRFKV